MIFEDIRCGRATWATELELQFDVIFQVLTQEDWNVVLFNGMEKTSHWAALYFVALMTFGNYVLFNLLVAILVEGFSSEVGLIYVFPLPYLKPVTIWCERCASSSGTKGESESSASWQNLNCLASVSLTTTKFSMTSRTRDHIPVTVSHRWPLCVGVSCSWLRFLSILLTCLKKF